jgi:hypothetical protein
MATIGRGAGVAELRRGDQVSRHARTARLAVVAPRDARRLSQPDQRVRELDLDYLTWDRAYRLIVELPGPEPPRSASEDP